VTPIEDQIRAYAEAITAGEHPRPERRDPTTPSPPGHRWAFAVAAAVLVAVIAVVAFVGMRTKNDTSLTVSKTSGDLTTELTVSNPNPGSGDVLEATLRVTNHGTDSIEVPLPCSMIIVVRSDGGPPVAYDSGSTELESFLDTQMAAGFFKERAKTVQPTLTYDQITAAMAGDTSALEDDCSRRDRTTLDPGQSLVTTKQIALGALGLRPGPGTVESELIDPSGPPNVSIGITIPQPATDPINRDQAIRAVLADPTVVAIVRSLPTRVPDPGATESTVVQSGTNGGGTISPPSTDTSQAPQGISGAWPIEGDGWQVAWVTPDGGFLATVTRDGTVTVEGARAR
jgi:hypothetical protein